MDVRKRGLGRGLGALIPEAAAASAGADQPAVVLAPIEAIERSPYQPREAFEESAIAEMAASIRQNGLLQPLLVRRVGSRYQLIAGERRWRAAQRAGSTHVPVTVRDVGDRESLELALIENLQRENLNPMEEARAFRRLSEEFKLAQEEIALKVGKSRSTVTNSMRLLHLPGEIQAQLESGVLSAGHARSLLALDSAALQLEAAREIARKRLSVRDTEKLVRDRTRPPAVDIEQQALEAQLSKALATRVRLRHRRDGSGRIVIEYYSLDELSGLLERLGVTAATRAPF
jgi:ParB family chromosome partitioning protein